VQVIFNLPEIRDELIQVWAALNLDNRLEAKRKALTILEGSSENPPLADIFVERAKNTRAGWENHDSTGNKRN